MAHVYVIDKDAYNPVKDMYFTGDGWSENIHNAKYYATFHSAADDYDEHNMENYYPSPGIMKINADDLFIFT